MILLVWLAIGWRESIIVGAAVVVTLALTLFASWAWGFTLNRVSLFALIFSIGILVDDAIVVVENIHRHMALSKARLLDLMPTAVDEVGGPTILATFTVIAALLPMAFVSGLMGPYMSPIPINASLGMLISLAVAFVFTPWMTNFMLGRRHDQALAAAGPRGTPWPRTGAEGGSPVLARLFETVIGPFLVGRRGNRNRWLLLAGILVLIAGSMLLVVNKAVILKMLPFDNKSEFQVVLDMPEGTSLEQTARVLAELGEYLATVPEVTDYQAYAGTATPINFNGLVRQYYLREGAHLGDLQVNLVDKHDRDRQSHAIAVGLRAPLAGDRPPSRRQRQDRRDPARAAGPLAPGRRGLRARLRGPDRAVASQVRGVFESTADIVDVDDSVEYPAAEAGAGDRPRQGGAPRRRPGQRRPGPGHGPGRART